MSKVVALTAIGGNYKIDDCLAVYHTLFPQARVSHSASFTSTVSCHTRAL